MDRVGCPGAVRKGVAPGAIGAVHAPKFFMALVGRTVGGVHGAGKLYVHILSLS